MNKLCIQFKRMDLLYHPTRSTFNFKCVSIQIEQTPLFDTIASTERIPPKKKKKDPGKIKTNTYTAKKKSHEVIFVFIATRIQFTKSIKFSLQRRVLGLWQMSRSFNKKYYYNLKFADPHLFYLRERSTKISGLLLIISTQLKTTIEVTNLCCFCQLLFLGLVVFLLSCDAWTNTIANNWEKDENSNWAVQCKFDNSNSNTRKQRETKKKQKNTKKQSELGSHAISAELIIATQIHFVENSDSVNKDLTTRIQNKTEQSYLIFCILCFRKLAEIRRNASNPLGIDFYWKDETQVTNSKHAN